MTEIYQINNLINHNNLLSNIKFFPFKIIATLSQKEFPKTKLNSKCLNFSF